MTQGWVPSFLLLIYVLANVTHLKSTSLWNSICNGIIWDEIFNAHFFIISFKIQKKKVNFVSA